jgi:Sec-independent protein translocase protein TatA
VGPELLLLAIALVVVLAWRGPSALPRLGEAFGKAVKGAREHMPGGAKDEADAPAGGAATSGAVTTGAVTTGTVTTGTVTTGVAATSAVPEAPEGEPRPGS